MPNDHAEPSEPTSASSTPRKTSPTEKANNAPTTPAGKASATPKSAPAATSHQRPRSNSKKPIEPPSLLTDFLLGRPSPARLQAQREQAQREQAHRERAQRDREAAERDREAVKATLKQAMRESVVKKVQPPGGVRDRVKQWQKTNAAAMVAGDPDDAATEPTDVAFNGEDVDSVTEEDRIRIKMRQKKKTYLPKAKSPTQKTDAKSKPSTDGESSKAAPKKRVVSDDHWMKTKNRERPPPRKVSSSARRRVSPRVRQRSPPRAQIPPDFTLRTAANPSVKNKITSWAKLVQEADTTPPASFLSRRTGSDSGSEVTASELTASETASQTTARRSVRLRPKSPRSGGDDGGIKMKPIRKNIIDDDGIRVTPSEVSRAYTDDGIRVTPLSISKNKDGIRVTSSIVSKTSKNDDGIRVTPFKTSRDDDGIKVTPSNISRDDDGIRITPSNIPRDDDGIRITPSNTSRDDDGIRITPLKTSSNKDSFKVRPQSSKSSDVSFQTATQKAQTRSGTLPFQKTNPMSGRIETEDESGSEVSELSSADGLPKDGEQSEPPQPINLSKSEKMEVSKDQESDMSTPTKRKASRTRLSTKKAKVKTRLPTHPKTTDDASWVDEGTQLGPEHILGSDLASSLANKSIADLPGDIPFGNSAFSELEMPTNGGPLRTRPKQPKRQAADRKSSLKGMPALLQKVMEEGKKIIQDMNDPPPRPPAPNNPPSIEKWLNNTVDPFVEESEPETTPTKQTQADSPKGRTPESVKQRTPESVKQRTPDSVKQQSPKSAKKRTPEPVKERTLQPEPSREKMRRQPSLEHTSKAEPAREQKMRQSSHQSTPETELSREPKIRRRVSHESKNSIYSSSQVDTDMSEETSAFSTEITDSTTRPQTPRKPRTPDSGLKRRSATRSSPSQKSAGKRPFLGFVRDVREAFQGESKGYKKPAISYTSTEERTYDDSEEELTEDDRTISGYNSRAKNYYDETPTTSELSSAYSSVLSTELSTPRPAGPRLRPPTNGKHELSTILSEEGSSAAESGLSSCFTQSDITQSVHTQSKTLSRNSGLSRSKKGGSGLKRRLTRHDDLVSVLSLPEDISIPNKMLSTRSRPSLRRARDGTVNVSADELLQEFAFDEDQYLRELKTLVKGVVPVLLTAPADHYFGPPGQKRDALANSVVGMGVALEKMRNMHKEASYTDIHELARWAHEMVPAYHSYLSSWRLGFEDLVVNLAPPKDDPEDKNCLFNAMPKDENGYVLNKAGERVDVAHLLKRPLIRIKNLVKLLKSVDSIYCTEDTQKLVQDFTGLQDKARRRHREETARAIDEDAINTDTTRCRDLRTLGALDDAKIPSNLQVNAKDIFSLQLVHSNDQRLECQVELVHRDNRERPEEIGDLLIRETGGGRRAYLLFPPILMSSVSARTGESNTDMVIMIRGWHHERPWHELLTVTSDSEDQVQEWLEILPKNPVPPSEPEPSVVGEDDEEPLRVDVPFGARSSVRRKSRQFSFGEVTSPPDSSATPPRRVSNRYQPRGPSLPTTPSTIIEESETHTYDRTPTQDEYRAKSPEFDRRGSPEEWMRPEPLKVKKKRSSSSYREDGAPPPPIHRTLSMSSLADAGFDTTGPAIEPPVELKSSGKVRRRTSSPLKHEYLPSDVSSGSEMSYVEEEEEDEDEDGRSDDNEEGEQEGELSEAYSDEYSSSDDDDIERVDVPETELGVSIRREHQDDPSKYGHLYAPQPLESALGYSECSLTPSNSASQAGLQRQENEAPLEERQLYAATISRWSDKGVWKDILDAPCSIFVTAGQIEAYAMEDDKSKDEKPLLAMDLTPLVLIRQSTAVDLEIRSSVQAHCKISKTLGGGNFRFRCLTGPDCFNLYTAVHDARLKNERFIQLANEARFSSFGQQQAPVKNDGDMSSRRRSWFGRKNSYRSSVRAPSHDAVSTQTGSTNISATSFLKRITVAGNMTWNISQSSVNKQGRPNSARNSLYTSDSSSFNGTNSPRSPSISIEPGSGGAAVFNSENIRIRLHLLISSSKWEDHGNCSLQLRHPQPGMHQQLRANHGMEKRVTVTTLPKKQSLQPKIVIDAVLGSGCFQKMGAKGIVCAIWEPNSGGGQIAKGGTGGRVTKWCFQCANNVEANWVLRMVHQEVQLMRV